MFSQAHDLGMYTVLVVLPAESRGSKQKEADYHGAADLTAQAINLGVTIQADIIKQKLPVNQRWIHGSEFRQDQQKRYIFRSGQRTIDRSHAISGHQLCIWAAAGLINSGWESRPATAI